LDTSFRLMKIELSFVLCCVKTIKPLKFNFVFVNT
jgi:hypothetical protein